MIVMQGVLLACVALLAAAALHDIMARTVPNWIAGCIALCGLALQSVQGTVLIGSAVALAVFLLLMVFWRRGWMGGADVKLIGAAVLLVPPASVPGLILAVTVSGSVLAIPYAVARRRIARPGGQAPAGLFARVVRTERWRLRRGGPLPYAVAIACGTTIAVATGGSFG